jgi:hypothetical protein
MKVREQAVGLATDSERWVGQATVNPVGIASLHAAYHSQGLDCWRYEQRAMALRCRRSCRPGLWQER